MNLNLTLLCLFYLIVPGDDWTECNKCFGSGERMCASCKGMGSIPKDKPIICKAPSHPRCQDSCDGWDYKCRVCGYIQISPYGNPIYCQHEGTPGTQSKIRKCSCPTTQNVSDWNECKPCGGSGSLTCRFCNGEGGSLKPRPPSWIPPSRPSAGYTQIDFLVGGVLQSYATKDIIISIERENANTSSNGTGWEVWGTAYYEITLNAGENIGKKNIEARINWDNKSRETNKNNNVKTSQMTVIPATNLTVEMVEPNAYYRTGTEVITTYIIHNKDNIGELNITPKHKLTAEFTATNQTGKRVASVTKTDIVIPKKGSNIVYFKWKVPEDYPLGDVKLQCDINTTKVSGSVGVPGVNEMDYTDNTAVGKNTVKSGKLSETPDTVFENRPNGFVKPNATDTVDYTAFAKELKRSTTYEEWQWVNGNYHKATYSLNLSAKLKLASDIRNPSFNVNGDRHEIKSGYGISLNGNLKLNNPNNAPNTAFTLPQSGNAHFPENRYSGLADTYRTLEQTSIGNFEFYKNRFALNDKGQSENRRVHFTSLWYPDGDYKVATYYYDCWTPSGMLSTIAEDKVIIKGNMYNDWYLSHSDKKK